MIIEIMDLDITYASPTSTTCKSTDFYGAGDDRYNKDVMESGGSVYTRLR
jgi:hypothetical protein